MDIETAKDLLASEKYIEAGVVLDALLEKEPRNDSLWYVRGILSLKLKKYDSAQEAFARAIAIRRKTEYFRMKGIAHMEIFELDDAVASFEKSIEQDENDALSLFFLSVCYMFYDNPLSVHYIQKAYEADKKRTKQLIKNFYSYFFGSSRSVGEDMKRALAKKISEIA